MAESASIQRESEAADSFDGNLQKYSPQKADPLLNLGEWRLPLFPCFRLSAPLSRKPESMSG
jgi:hypothetical protein